MSANATATTRQGLTRQECADSYYGGCSHSIFGQVRPNCWFQTLLFLAVFDATQLVAFVLCVQRLGLEHCFGDQLRLLRAYLAPVSDGTSARVLVCCCDSCTDTPEDGSAAENGPWLQEYCQYHVRVVPWYATVVLLGDHTDEDADLLQTQVDDWRSRMDADSDTDTDSDTDSDSDSDSE